MIRSIHFKPSQEQIDRGKELAKNPYPGRIAIMGISRNNDLAIQAYALTGRSSGSRDRIFTQEETSVRTIAPHKTPEEMAKVKNAKLIYYRAIKNAQGVHVVSNGAQTDPVLQSILDGNSLEHAIRNAPEVEGEIDEATGVQEDPIKLSHYEPDKPNYTPRITGVIDLRRFAPTPFGLSIVSKDPNTDKPIYSTYERGDQFVQPGIGYGVQTYNGLGEPLPSFDQEPYAYSLGEGLIDTAYDLWDTLNEDTRVAVVVRGIDLITKEPAGTVILPNQV